MNPDVLCRIRLLGPLHVTLDGANPVKFPTRKVEALFAMIVLADGRGLDRDVAASMLWSRSPEGQARANLRQALAGVRKALGDGSVAIESRGTLLVLNSSYADSDTQSLTSPPDNGKSHDADWLLDLGQLLDGVDLREPPFEEWILQERQKWMRLLCGRLVEVAEADMAAGRHDRALALAQRLIGFDDLNENAHRLAMVALHASGESAAALRQYDELSQRLKVELNIAPGQRTTELAAEIRSGKTTEGAVDLPKSAPPPKARLDAPVETRQPSPSALRTVVALVGSAHAAFGDDDDLDNPRAESAAIRNRDRIAAEVASHGGLLLQNTGASFQAIFGAFEAHSNDAERAIQCARAIMDADRMESVAGWSQAAAAGRMLVEAAASEAAPSLIGAPLERAQDHLRAAEPNVIVVDQAVRDATQRIFQFEGAGGPDLWRVSGRIDTDRRPALTKFVGREAEFARIRDMLQDVATRNEGEVLLLRGEAGIGKTRLIEEIVQTARGENYRVASVGALDFGAGKAEGPVPALAKALLDGADLDLTVLDAAIMAELTHREPSQTEREMLATLDRAGRDAEHARVMGRLLARSTRRGPLLIVVEDLHWAGNTAVNLLADLAAAAKDLPVAIIMTTRPVGDPVDAGWRRRCAGLRIGTIDLAPLRAEAARRLVSSVGALPDALVDGCLDRAQGNPLFLEHLVRSAPRLRGLNLPLSVQSVVQEELDQLSPSVCKALRAGATLGQVFTLGAFAAVTNDATLSEDDLLSGNLVVRRGDRLIFVHAIVRDGVYASIPARDRATLHKRAADWFEGHDPVLCAEHLDKAGDPAATDAYVLAAREERGAGRSSEALRLLERAFAIAVAAAPETSARLLHADLLTDLERFSEAIDTYRGIADVDIDTLLSCHLGAAECLMRLDRHDEALQALDDAQYLLAREPLSPRAATIPYLRATIQFAQGAAAQSVKNSQIARDLAQQSGDRVLEARALSAMADAEQACGRFQSAERAFASCVELCNAIGLRRYAVVNRKMCGDLKFYDAKFQEARQILEEVRVEAKALGSGRGEMLAEHMLAYVDSAEAKFDDALDRARRARAMVEILKAPRFIMNNACYAAMALTGLGRNAEAIVCLREAEAMARKLKVTWILPWVLAQRALSEPAFDDVVKALQAAEALIDAGAGSYPLDFYLPAIDAAIRIGDWTRVQSYSDALKAFFAEEPVGLADFLIQRASLIASAHLGRPCRSSLTNLIKWANQIGYVAAIPALEQALAAGVP